MKKPDYSGPKRNSDGDLTSTLHSYKNAEPYVPPTSSSRDDSDEIPWNSDRAQTGDKEPKRGFSSAWNDFKEDEEEQGAGNFRDPAIVEAKLGL